MTYKEKILFTFCAYLKDGYGCTSFKELFSNDDPDYPFEYIKNNFIDQVSRVQHFLEELNKYQINYLCYWEDLYPSKMRELLNPPMILFYRGDIGLLNKEIITVVGTRSCTKDSEVNTRNFVKVLAQQYVIASGLALGVDCIANNTSSDLPAKSIVVVPGSLVNPHPPSNKIIYEKVLSSGGLAISEYPLTDAIEKGSFVIRNRILAGIATSLLLIQSSKDGGSMITCKAAKELSLQMYSIPANISLKSFEGNNWLIKTEQAKLVTEPEDILRDNNKFVFSNISYKFNKEEEEIIESLRLYKNFDDLCIAMKGKLPFNKIYDIMLDLEMSGIINRDISGNYIVN